MAGPGPWPPASPQRQHQLQKVARTPWVLERRIWRTYLQGGSTGSSVPGEGARAHAFLRTVASAAPRRGAHPLGWMEGGVVGETCTEEELGQGGGAPRRATPGTGVWSWWTRPSPGLLRPLPTSGGAWPTLQLRLRSGHQPPQARGPGRRRGAAGGTTRCTRPPLAPPGLRHALRPSAAAGAGELRGRAQRLRLQLRHPLRPATSELGA